MNTDFRLSVEFIGHHKTLKLESRLGGEGILALIRLWSYAAKNRPDGDLVNMTEEDIAIAAGWRSEAKDDFAQQLLEIGFLDKEGDLYILHDWLEHNAWAADADNRSNEARFNILKRWHPDLAMELEARGILAITKEEYEAIKKGGIDAVIDSYKHGNRVEIAPYTSANTPSLSPSPSLSTNKAYCVDTEAEAEKPGKETKKAPQKKPLLVAADAEERILAVLRSAGGGYQFDHNADLEQIRKLSEEFPHVDILAECKRMCDWLSDNPGKRGKNSRSFMRNWMTKAAAYHNRVSYQSRAAPQGPSRPRDPEAERRAREFEEKRRQQVLAQFGGDCDGDGNPVDARRAGVRPAEVPGRPAG